jgi:hypothetical protein
VQLRIPNSNNTTELCGARQSGSAIPTKHPSSSWFTSDTKSHRPPMVIGITSAWLIYSASFVSPS